MKRANGVFAPQSWGEKFLRAGPPLAEVQAQVTERHQLPSVPAGPERRPSLCFHYGQQKLIISNWKIILS